MNYKTTEKTNSTNRMIEDGKHNEMMEYFMLLAVAMATTVHKLHKRNQMSLICAQQAAHNSVFWGFVFITQAHPSAVNGGEGVTVNVPFINTAIIQPNV
jgi:hypothetical protein